MIPVQLITRIENRLRPLLQTILPNGAYVKLYSASRNFYLQALAAHAKKMPMIQAGGQAQVLFPSKINFRNDLGNAAGFDKDGSLLEFNYKLGAGFAIVGTALAAPHTGNLISLFGYKVNPWVPLPKSEAALNSLGLPNKGIDQALTNIKKFRAEFPESKKDFPIGLSLMGHPKQDAGQRLFGLLVAIKKSEGIADFLEINESCPNCEHDQDLELFRHRLSEIMRLRESFSCYLPILLKLGSLDNLAENIKLFTELKVDGLVLTNTQKDYTQFRPKISPEDRALYDYYTGRYQGGLSGKVIYDFAYAEVQKASQEIIRQKSHLKLIHVGGLTSASDLQQSRQNSSVVLREWYTGLLEQMGNSDWAKIYSNVLASTNES